jgi:hypothetical protein
MSGAHAPLVPTMVLAAKSATSVLTWAGLLIVAAVGLGLAILILRRYLLAKDIGGEAHVGLMESLRAMRDEGRISPEEFDIAKRRMAARAAGRSPDQPAAPRVPPASPTRTASARTTPARPAPELRSRPGFDLTGAPLPKPGNPTPPPQ